MHEYVKRHSAYIQFWILFQKALIDVIALPSTLQLIKGITGRCNSAPGYCIHAALALCAPNAERFMVSWQSVWTSFQISSVKEYVKVCTRVTVGAYVRMILILFFKRAKNLTQTLFQYL